MSSQVNKAIVQRLYDEVIIGGNLELMNELVAPDFVNHHVVGTGEESTTLGVEPFRQQIRAFRTAFPDLTVEIIHLLADGDRVVIHVRARCTHHGDFRGMPATAKHMEIQSVIIFRIADGRLAERWNVIDRYGMLQQLGMLPSQ